MGRKPRVPPRSAADRRPGDMPFFIENRCESCGHELVSAQPYVTVLCWDPELKQCVDRPGSEVKAQWFDEFICPVCLGDVYLDWPAEDLEELMDRGERARLGLDRAYPHEKWTYLRRVGMVDRKFEWVGRPREKRRRRC